MTEVLSVKLSTLRHVVEFSVPGVEETMFLVPSIEVAKVYPGKIHRGRIWTVAEVQHLFAIEADKEAVAGLIQVKLAMGGSIMWAKKTK